MIAFAKDTPLPGSPRPTVIELRRAIEALSVAIAGIRAGLDSLHAAISGENIAAARAGADRLARQFAIAAQASRRARDAAFYINEMFKDTVERYVWPVLRDADTLILRGALRVPDIQKALREIRVDPGGLILNRDVIGWNRQRAHRVVTQLVVHFQIARLEARLDQLLLRI